jgi:hypothetical protein
MECSGYQAFSGQLLLQMQKLLAACGIIACFWALSGCSKDHEPTPVPPVKTPRATGPRLDSMVWNNLATTTYFSYRPDSLQDKITTVSTYVSDTVRFTYNGRQLSHITNNRLQRSSDYFYNAAGQITLVTMDEYSGTGHFRFAYGYNGAGQLNSLAISLDKAGTTEQLYSCSYVYDTNGLLSKVNGMSPDGSTVTLTIDGYTDECNFNPWILAEPVDPSEVVEIDNLPFLQSTKRLPVKITKTGNNGIIRRQLTATIKDHNLSKAVIGREFSGSPASNFQTDVDFFYHP